MDQFPVLQTNRLRLRQLNQADADDMYRMRSDPAMIMYTDSKLDETPDETRAYIEKMNRGVADGKWLIWAMERRESQQVIGTISVWNLDREAHKAELGYGLIPSYQHQGFMKETLLAVIAYAFGTMKLRTLEAYTETNNVHSKNLLVAANFRLVKQVSEPGYYSDRVYVMDVYEVANSMIPMQ